MLKDKFITLLEATREDIKKYYPSVSDEDYNKIIDADPTSTKDKVGNLSRLVLDLHKKQKLKLDKEVLHDIYVAFDVIQKKKNNLTGTPFEKYRNLNAIPDADVLLDIKHYLDQKTSSKVKLKASEGENIETFYEDDNWVVKIPLDYQSSVKLGRECDANWCTASSQAAIHFNRYIVQNDLFVVINKKTNEAYQYFSDGDDVEFNDNKNKTINVYGFMTKNPEAIKLIEKIEEQSAKNKKNPDRLLERYKTTGSLYIVIAAIERGKTELIDKLLKIVDKKKLNEHILVSDHIGTFNRDKEYTTINTELHIKGYNVPYNAEMVDLLCKKFNIGYVINDDLSVDSLNTVYFSNYYSLTKIPIKFNKVQGSFMIENTKISTLENAPKYVSYDFIISDNKITSLKGGPIEVGHHYICSGNELTNLEGAPKKVPGDFICSNGTLTSLKGSPEEVGGFFKCWGNNLESLKGAPKKVDEGFVCFNNAVEFTKEDVEKVCEVNGEIRVKY